MSKKKKGRTKPAEPKSSGKKRVRTAEIVGVLLVFFALFLLVSIFSYNSKDPSWASLAPSGSHTRNFGGKVGAYLAEAVIQFLGISAFALPFFFGYLGYKAIIADGKKRFLLKIGSIVFLLAILCSLFTMLFQRFSWGGADIEAGGLTGELVSSLLVGFFNTTGTLIFLLALLALFIVFSTEFSFKKLMHVFERFFSFAFREVRIRIVQHRKSKNRERMRQKVIEKYASPAEARETGWKPAEEGGEDEEEEEEESPGRQAKEEKKKELPRRGGKPEPLIVHAPKPAPEKMLFPEMEKREDYTFPPFSLLDPAAPADEIDKNELYEKKQRIEEKLKEFKVEGEVREYHPGPIITTYEFYPYPGIKVSQVANLAEDLSLALGAESVRIQRIPGKSSLGVEIPNNKRETIKLRDIIQSEKFVKSPSKLTIALGKDVHGEVTISDLSVMPHLLIAGATGTGKSVALNALIASILYKATPDEVKLILIDPKRLEFTLYDGVPHLLSPVINDPKKAGSILMDAIKKMEERYHKLSFLKVRNIEQYNSQIRQVIKEKKGKLTEEEAQKLKPLPYIVIIIDELAELMMVGAQEVEYCIARLAQLARAVGIHLVMATQRPSIDVITGTIKNNFSSRIAFRVPSKIDSRIIIDTSGAEKLLGLGDMLFMPPNYPRIVRLHCAYISIPEVTRLVKFVKEQGTPEYDEKLIRVIKSPAEGVWEGDGERDALYDKAVELVLVTGQASASYLQRKMKLGYARAARIIDQMEQEGILGPSEGSKPRDILVDAQAYLKENEKSRKSKEEI
jgi:S-DNA-T family DNA segregation ATPase FtsK/SpoIIIE